jgi:hypothetical protein
MMRLSRCANTIPSTDELCEFPQLATIAVLQDCLRVAGQVLSIQHPETGALCTMPPDFDTESILAQLMIDRCRELSELITCYRQAIDSPASCRDFDFLPF